MSKKDILAEITTIHKDISCISEKTKGWAKNNKLVENIKNQLNEIDDSDMLYYNGLDNILTDIIWIEISIRILKSQIWEAREVIYDNEMQKW